MSQDLGWRQNTTHPEKQRIGKCDMKNPPALPGFVGRYYFSQGPGGKKFYMQTDPLAAAKTTDRNHDSYLDSCCLDKQITKTYRVWTLHPKRPFCFAARLTPANSGWYLGKGSNCLSLRFSCYKGCEQTEPPIAELSQQAWNCHSIRNSLAISSSNRPRQTHKGPHWKPDFIAREGHVLFCFCWCHLARKIFGYLWVKLRLAANKNAFTGNLLESIWKIQVLQTVFEACTYAQALQGLWELHSF